MWRQVYQILLKSYSICAVGPASSHLTLDFVWAGCLYRGVIHSFLFYLIKNLRCGGRSCSRLLGENSSGNRVDQTKMAVYRSTYAHYGSDSVRWRSQIVDALRIGHAWVGTTFWKTIQTKPEWTQTRLPLIPILHLQTHSLSPNTENKKHIKFLLQ